MVYYTPESGISHYANSIAKISQQDSCELLTLRTANVSRRTPAQRSEFVATVGSRLEANGYRRPAHHHIAPASVTTLVPRSVPASNTLVPPPPFGFARTVAAKSAEAGIQIRSAFLPLHEIE